MPCFLQFNDVSNFWIHNLKGIIQLLCPLKLCYFPNKTYNYDEYLFCKTQKYNIERKKLWFWGIGFPLPFHLSAIRTPRAKNQLYVNLSTAIWSVLEKVWKINVLTIHQQLIWRVKIWTFFPFSVVHCLDLFPFFILLLLRVCVCILIWVSSVS